MKSGTPEIFRLVRNWFAVILVAVLGVSGGYGVAFAPPHEVSYDLSLIPATCVEGQCIDLASIEIGATGSNRETGVQLTFNPQYFDGDNALLRVQGAAKQRRPFTVETNSDRSTTVTLESLDTGTWTTVSFLARRPAYLDRPTPEEILLSVSAPEGEVIKSSPRVRRYNRFLLYLLRMFS